MSVSEEGEALEAFDNEQINDFEHLYLLPEYTATESSVSVESIQAKWKKVPRSPSDFSESKSKTSSCRDSDYEAWLENYYKDLLKNANKQTFAEIGVDTSDLLRDEKAKNIRFSKFQPKLKKWSYSTKYWGPNQGRRHWALEKKENDVMFLPTIHPILNLRSRYGRFQSQLNSAAAVPESTYKRFICGTFKKVIERSEILGPQLFKIMICDNLCYLKWFDFMTKATTTKTLCRFLRSQFMMDNVYIENADLGRQEGIVFLCALSQNAGSNLKELHIWKMFGYGQCPVLLNELTRRGKLEPAKTHIKFLAKIHYLQILNKFENLMSLSVNYSYLANQNGDVLLCLKSVRTRSLKELRILCLKDERPLVTNPGYGVGGCKIPDGVWRRIAQWNPDLRVHFVFLNMPQYENVILFLSKNIPMSHVYLSSGIDLNFEVPWDIDSTLLELRNWYSSTLQDLSLHLWHHRDLLDFVIRVKILEEFPNLLNFEFIGVLEDVETLEEFCCQLSRGTYKMKTLLFWVQEQYTNEKKCLLKRKRVAEIRNKYKRKFQENKLSLSVALLAFDADFRSLKEVREKYLDLWKMPPYVNFVTKDDTIILQGCYGQLWTILEERLGFSSQYMVESYNMGVLNFQNKRRDVLLRPSVISSDDVDNFDFTYPIGSTWYVLYLKDSDEINSSNSYVRNWSMGIWIFTALMIFLFTAALYIMFHVSEKFLRRSIFLVPAFEGVCRITQYYSAETNKFILPNRWRKMKKEHRRMKIKNEQSLGNCFVAAISVFCSQGVYFQTEVTSIRLLILSFLIFGMIMFNSYSALLVSQLTLGERFLSFETLEEIPVKGEGYALCVRPESYPYLYFTVNNSGYELQPKWASIINRKPCPKEGTLSLVEMCQPFVAFLEAPAVMNEYILNNVNCKMTSLKGKYFYVDLSLMLLKGFDEKARKELNTEILRYREAGILSYLREKWIRPNKIPLGTDNQKLQVTFEHIKGVLLVYVCSIGFSCSIFYVEVLAYFINKHWRKFLLAKNRLI